MRTANNMMFLSMYRNQLTRRSIDDWQFGGCIMSKHDKCAFMKIQCLSIFLASKHHVHTVCVHYLIYLHFLNLWQWKVVFKAVKVIAYMATDTSHPTHMQILHIPQYIFVSDGGFREPAHAFTFQNLIQTQSAIKYDEKIVSIKIWLHIWKIINKCIKSCNRSWVYGFAAKP